MTLCESEQSHIMVYHGGITPTAPLASIISPSSNFEIFCVFNVLQWISILLMTLRTYCSCFLCIGAWQDGSNTD
jgi:hypothetical protein